MEEDQIEAEQIRISLVLAKGYDTADNDADSNDGDDKESLRVPSEPIAIPSDTRRKGLSAIVNHLLNRKVVKDTNNVVSDSDNDEDMSDSDSDDEEKLPAIPFDFLLQNKLLRMSVDAAARREGLSLEQAVVIEYFPAKDVPRGGGETESLPDWISAMDHNNNNSTKSGSNDGWLSTGACDGSIRVYHCNSGNSTNDDNDGGKGVLSQDATIKAHSGAIKCLSSTVLQDAKTMMIASGSLDQTLLTHIYRSADTTSSDEDDGLALHAVYSGGHSSAISSTALLPTSSSSSSSDNGELLLASGDWDGGLCIWKVPQLEASDQDGDNDQQQQQKSKKKRKSDNGGSSSSSSTMAVKEVSPTLSFKAHSNNMSGIAWGHDESSSASSSSASSKLLFTSSWDHSIKSWDVESQNVILTLNGSKVVTCLDRCHQSNVLASGHPDCTVRLWDMRTKQNGDKSDGGVFDNTLRPSHKEWISSVKWSQSDPYVLASSSFDGTVKVWDIRSSIPLHTIKAHPKKKALCLAFAKDTIYSGGSDCVVKQFKY